jgi:hypothetical protein
MKQGIFLSYIFGLIFLVVSNALPLEQAELNYIDSTVNHPQNTPANETDPGEWIAYIGLDNNIWLIHPDGSGTRQITSNAGEAGSYSKIKWSPDGKILAYVFHNQKKNVFQLKIFESSSEKERKIYEQYYFGIDWGYDWTPDSKAIAYLVGGDLTLIYLSSQESENYADSYLGNEIQWKMDSNYEIEWSPSGKEIFLGCSSDIRCAGYLYSVETGDNQILADFLKCKWSPNGIKLICIIPKESNGFIPESLLGFLDATSGNISEIESTRIYYPNGYTSILWSPDGKKIGGSSYLMDVVGGPASFLLNPDTLEQTNLGETALLDWAPDSQKILGKDINQKILIIDINSKNKTYLTDGVEAVWQPKPSTPISQNIESIPPIENLMVTPGEKKGEVKLEWTVPVIDKSLWDQYFYDIRNSNLSLNDANWKNEKNNVHDPIALNSGINSIIWSDQPLAETRYYAIRIIDQNGNSIGPISNNVFLIDSGFRINVDGYGFSNGPKDQNDPIWGYYPKDAITLTDFTFEDARNIFSDKYACLGLFGCTPNPIVSNWVIAVNSMMNDGHCVGISSTSAYFFYNQDSFQQIKPGSESVYKDIELQDVRRLIARDQALQLADPVFNYMIQQEKTSSISTTLDHLIYAFQNKQPVFVTIIERGIKNISGRKHAITPIAISWLKNRYYKIWFYNSSNNESKTMVLDLDKDLWTIKDQWYGSSNDHSFYIIPIDLFQTKQTLTNESVNLAIVKYLPKVLYTEINNGLRFGFNKIGQIVKEIPEANVTTYSNSDDQIPSLIYSIPADQDYTIDFSNTFLDKGQILDFTQIGPKYSLSIITTPFKASTTDYVSINKDGTQVEYQSSSDKQIDISLSLIRGNETFDYMLRGLDMNAGKKLSLYEKPDENIFVVSGAQFNSGNYDIKIIQPNFSGERTYSSNNIYLAEGDTHSYVLDPRGLSNESTLLVDHGSDGSIDEEIKLKNGSQNTISVWWIVSGGITILCCGTIIIGLVLFLFLYRRKKTSAKFTE